MHPGLNRRIDSRGEGTVMENTPADDGQGRPFGPVWADYVAARGRFFAQLEGDPDAPHAHIGGKESQRDVPFGLAADAG
jgi:hypothetical protein